METRLFLSFAAVADGRAVEVETIAYDAGDNNLTIISIDPARGLHLRSGYDYEDGRKTIAVADNWRERGRPGHPEFRLLEEELSEDVETLRRSCLYDHVGRFMDFAALATIALRVDDVDRAAAALNPPLTTKPRHLGGASSDPNLLRDRPGFI
jgi:hypothetical protein